jgi:Rieske Fe-S protein
MGYPEHINLTRRKMIRALGGLALISLTGIWVYMVRREQFRAEGRISQRKISDIPQGISYYEDYWINRDTEGFKVFSTRCTHLGCKVRQSSIGQLICPCHGSSFDEKNGVVIKGPAVKPLEMLNFIVEEDHLKIFIK